MSDKLYFWGERYLFSPTPLQKIIAFLLLPVTFIYCILTFLKRTFSKPEDFGIPVVSVGNLIVGGSGKTPITIELAKRYSSVGVILRGYGRQSKGLVVVSNFGDIKCDVKRSGDEAMLLASSLPNATIIVSEDRKKAIKKAKELGCKVVFLDDGYSKFDIKKFDLLLKPDMKLLPFCLPSGAYRFSPQNYQTSDLCLVENKDFKRVVSIKNPTKKMILLTAISKPQRLEKFIDKDIPKIYLPDHSEFSKEFIDSIITKHNPTSILTTTKDAVKLKSYNLALSILELEIEIDEEKVKKIDDFIRKYDARKSPDS